MRAKVIVRRRGATEIALAAGLGLATIIGLATMVRAETASAPAPSVAGYTCEAPKGGWCDLRDWSGMDRWGAPAASLPQGEAGSKF